MILKSLQDFISTLLKKFVVGNIKYAHCSDILTGVPKFLRSDYGTENCIVASLQIAFHMSTLKEKSYIYGPSKRNVVCSMMNSDLK